MEIYIDWILKWLFWRDTFKYDQKMTSVIRNQWKVIEQVTTCLDNWFSSSFNTEWHKCRQWQTIWSIGHPKELENNFQNPSGVKSTGMVTVNDYVNIHQGNYLSGFHIPWTTENTIPISSCMTICRVFQLICFKNMNFWLCHNYA